MSESSTAEARGIVEISRSRFRGFEFAGGGGGGEGEEFHNLENIDREGGVVELSEGLESLDGLGEEARLGLVVAGLKGCAVPGLAFNQAARVVWSTGHTSAEVFSSSFAIVVILVMRIEWLLRE